MAHYTRVPNLAMDLVESLVLVLLLVAVAYIGFCMGRMLMSLCLGGRSAEASLPEPCGSCGEQAPAASSPTPRHVNQSSGKPQSHPLVPARLMHTRQVASVYSSPPVGDHLPEEALGNAEPRWRTSCQWANPRRRTHAPFE